MADTTPKNSAPIASGGRPASLANTCSNGTIGRIKCMRVAGPAEATDSPNKPAASAPAPIPGERPWYERSWDEIKRVADQTLQSWKKAGQTVWEAVSFTSDDATAAAARGRIGEGIIGSLEGLGTLTGPNEEMVQGAYRSGDPEAIALIEEMQRRQREAIGAIGDSVKQAWNDAYARNGTAGAVAMVLATLGMEGVGAKGLGALAKTAEKIADIVRLAKTPLEAANKLDEAIAAARAAGASADELALLERARAERLNQARKKAAKAKDGTVVVKKKPAPDGYRTYKTHGITERPDASPEGRRLVEEYKNQGLSEKDAIKKARELMESGSTPPLANPVEAGDRFYKVVPEGVTPGPKTEYWITKEQLQSLEGLDFDHVAGRLGMPLESQQAARFDVMEIKAMRPSTTFVSKIAPTTQNGWSQTGGAMQSLITDRSAFTPPVRTGVRLP